MPQLELLPEARRGAVADAMAVAFGARVRGRLRPISGGVSGALIFAFDAGAGSFVLRVEPDRIPLADRQRGFASMTAAAAAGVAPAVHFADPATGVAIMDFVDARPLAEHPGGPLGVVQALGGLVSKVQQTAIFPFLGHYPDFIARLLTGLKTSPLIRPGQMDAHAEGLLRIQAALAWDPATLVSSHNDPNPRNILFDGKRLWLIDWELAFRNDPLVDVAILTTELAQTPVLQDALVRAALGVVPDRHLRARLSLIRLLTQLFYGCIVLDSLVRAPSLAEFRDIPALTPSLFRTAVADGHLVSGSPQTAFAFAKMSLAAFLRGLQSSEGEQAIADLGTG